jgi:putative component of membrane protein insertase Oxa1/YidC/SpoIIIJ protein YidD
MVARAKQAVSGLLLGAACFLATGHPRAEAAQRDASSALAVALFGEGQWLACRTECLRQRRDGISVTAENRLLAATCAVRLGNPVAHDELAALLAATNTPPTVTALAQLELARALIAQGKPRAAVEPLKAAFVQSDVPAAALRGGYYLYQLFTNGDLDAAPDNALLLQLESCRPLWTPHLRAECRIVQPRRPRYLTRPAAWLIRFYQDQISPAIGNRCSLVPSCSRYAQQAISRHGIGGIPMIGDRFVREPSVVAAQVNPVLENGHRRYRDPIEDHEW